MSNQEILTKAIEKAASNGFELKSHHSMSRNSKTGEVFAYEGIIFDHDFAKALWPNSNKWLIRIFTPTGMQLTGQEVWEWEVHLQQMVRAEDPIAYLGEHL